MPRAQQEKVDTKNVIKPVSMKNEMDHQRMSHVSVPVSISKIVNDIRRQEDRFSDSKIGFKMVDQGLPYQRELFSSSQITSRGEKGIADEQEVYENFLSPNPTFKTLIADDSVLQVQISRVKNDLTKKMTRMKETKHAPSAIREAKEYLRGSGFLY